MRSTLDDMGVIQHKYLVCAPDSFQPMGDHNNCFIVGQRFNRPLQFTFYFDVFTKEILTYKVAERRGSREQYIEGLADVVELLKGCREPTIIHTDQGSVYSSKAYNELIKDTNIIRSMSRAGKPTDNPVNESLNG